MRFLTKLFLVSFFFSFVSLLPADESPSQALQGALREVLEKPIFSTFHKAGLVALSDDAAALSIEVLREFVSTATKCPHADQVGDILFRRCLTHRKRVQLTTLVGAGWLPLPESTIPGDSYSGEDVMAHALSLYSDLTEIFEEVVAGSSLYGDGIVAPLMARVADLKLASKGEGGGSATGAGSGQEGRSGIRPAGKKYPDIGTLTEGKRLYYDGDARAPVVLAEEAGKGDAESMRLLAWLYSDGDRVEGDDSRAFRLFSQATDLGSVEARYDLAMMHARGDGCKQDFKTARELLRACVANGYEKAKVPLGMMFEEGHGVPKNERQAVVLYKQAADAGLAEGLYLYGMALNHGIGGLEESREAAFPYLKEAAEKGSDGGMYMLGLAYLYGAGCSKQPREGVRWMARAADGGDEVAQVQIGDIYLDGLHGIKADPEKAFASYSLAAQKGYPPAKYKVGYCYHNGLGVSEDHNKALRLYREAAALGEEHALAALAIEYMPGACGKLPPDLKKAKEYLEQARANGNKDPMVIFSLGWAYVCGFGGVVKEREGLALVKEAADRGLPTAMLFLGDHARSQLKDNNTAVAWYRAAHNAGDPEGTYRLAEAYLCGVTVRRDFEEAARLFLNAGSNGYPDGLACYGRCVEFGRGRPKNPREAAEWYQKAANAGSSEGLFCLGVCYYRGNGVGRDQPKGKKLIEEAAAAGHPRAGDYRARMDTVGGKIFDALEKDWVDAIADGGLLAIKAAGKIFMGLF